MCVSYMLSVEFINITKTPMTKIAHFILIAATKFSVNKQKKTLPKGFFFLLLHASVRVSSVRGQILNGRFSKELGTLFPCRPTWVLDRPLFRRGN